MPVPLILFVWLVLFNPADGGKVIIKAEIEGVEFYLDGNFVAKTESDGTLRIDSLPAGTFRYSIRKNGFVSQEGSFSLADGETRTLAVKLISQGNPELPGPPAVHAPSKRAAARPRPTPQAHSTSDGSAPTGSVMPSTPNSPAAAGVVGTPDEGLIYAGWIVSGMLLAGAGGVFLFWSYRKRKMQQELAMDPVALLTPLPEPPPQPAPAPEAPKQVPEFIHKLKQREDLMKAGFVGAASREVARTEGKGREVVIVLPKEAYHYEEENDDTPKSDA